MTHKENLEQTKQEWQQGRFLLLKNHSFLRNKNEWTVDESEASQYSYEEATSLAKQFHCEIFKILLCVGDFVEYNVGDVGKIVESINGCIIVGFTSGMIRNTPLSMMGLTCKKAQEPTSFDNSKLDWMYEKYGYAKNSRPIVIG